MIIQHRGTELLFVRQGDHAALAAEIMSHWQLDGLLDHPRRDGILRATRDHDSGWNEEDALMHLDAAGAPLDFVAVPVEVKHRIWPRATARLGATSPYVAALVAQHALTVHAQLRNEPAWTPFFETMERERDTYVRLLPEGEADVARTDYPFVRTGDLLSLVFCNGWTTPMSGIGYRAILNGITLQVTPDPFGGRRVPMSVAARMLPARRYHSREDLQQAYARAPVLQLAGEAVGG